MSEYRKDSLKASEDEDIIGLYDKELHLEMLHNSELKEAREKGLEEGIEQGLERGLEQGRKEEKIETAKNLLKNGISLEIIMKSTGLSEEELNSLL